MFVYKLTTLLYYRSLSEGEKDSFPERLVPESRNGIQRKLASVVEPTLSCPFIAPQVSRTNFDRT